MLIHVNGVETTTDLQIATYEQVVELAGERGSPSVAYSYRVGVHQRAGTMYPGCKPIELATGMVFTVVHTGNA